MALRKKKNPQDDSETLQALLQSWDIPLPEKDKKSDFPETTVNDFPKADFPEFKSEPEPEKISPEPEKTPLPEPVSVPAPKKELDSETERKFKAVFQEHSSPKKKQEKNTLHLLTVDNPDLDKKFKLEAIQYMHGTVRLYSLELFLLIAVLIIFGFSVMYDAFVCFSILAFAAAAFLLWYASRWKLTFDGSTNRFSYQSLTCPEIFFHASEIESFQLKSGLRSPEEQIILSVYGQEIRIGLGFPQYLLSGQQGDYLGGYYNSRKLREYLEFYQSLHGTFNYSGLHYKTEKSESSSKEELLQMLAKYQKQIEENKKE